MSAATASMPFVGGVSWKTKTVRGRAEGISEELKEFRQLSGEGYRQSLAMGLTDDSVEAFINEVIHDGRGKDHKIQSTVNESK